jgi:hypothetical protein
MAYSHVSEDGLARSNDPSFTALWNDIGRRQQSERQAWVAEMVAKGARIVMADDGWVDRKLHTVSPPSYADRNQGAMAGELIALGGPVRWRIVRITKAERCQLMRELVYSFDSAAVEVSA